MARIVLRKESVQKEPTEETPIIDWDSFLYSLWLDIVKTNPRFCDDAKIDHVTGHCKCHCTASAFLTEVHRRRK